jgi:hypothetical protein
MRVVVVFAGLPEMQTLREAACRAGRGLFVTVGADNKLGVRVTVEFFGFFLRERGHGIACAEVQDGDALR